MWVVFGYASGYASPILWIPKKLSDQRGSAVILTGPHIRSAYEAGELLIDPFDPAHLNPNSYNFHLGPTILEKLPGRHDEVRPVPVTASNGVLLHPGKLYLAATEELIGSNLFVVTLLGRSSLGRLGLFLNVTADLGHSGSMSKWTLEMTVVQPLKVYVGMTLGQVSFWVQMGEMERYSGRYHRDAKPIPNRDPHLRHRSLSEEA